MEVCILGWRNTGDDKGKNALNNSFPSTMMEGRRSALHFTLHSSTLSVLNVPLQMTHSSRKSNFTDVVPCVSAYQCLKTNQLPRDGEHHTFPQPCLVPGHPETGGKREIHGFGLVFFPWLEMQKASCRLDTSSNTEPRSHWVHHSQLH